LEESKTLSIEEANELVVANQGWAESIARAVARAWNLDWRLDGLDGAAMEALIFCARRFEPSRGIPFRGYARKRVHEASADAARKSRGWRRGLGAMSKADQRARENSADLFNIFPELRSGELPYPEESDGGGEADVRGAIRTLIVGASILGAKQGLEDAGPEEIIDYKKMLAYAAVLEPVHQALLWKLYWEGDSMRSIAAGWEIDELNIIREHKVLLVFLQKSFNKGRAPERPRIRPGLKNVALKLKREIAGGPFQQFLSKQ
jgi:RNA polymerase sigma factor for flagellar operon FliA